MAALNDEQKLFIVQCLACYDTPSRVAEAVKEEFGISISRQHVQGYDPTKHTGRNLSEKWRTLFEDTRERFRKEAAEIPIAERAFRLRTLQRVMEKAESIKNLPMVLQTLEQAAKEVGDVFINKHQGVSVGVNVSIGNKAEDMTDDELAAIAAGGGAGITDTPPGS